jgi:hypothetical protein
LKNEEECLDRVKKAWLQLVVCKCNLSSFLLKLKNVKKSLMGWGINLRGSQLRRKKEILVGLQDLEILEELIF